MPWVGRDRYLKDIDSISIEHTGRAKYSVQFFYKDKTYQVGSFDSREKAREYAEACIAETGVEEI